MNTLRNLLSHLIIWVYSIYRKLFDAPDFKIISRELEYSIDPSIEYAVDEGGFWHKESMDWKDEILDNYFVDVTEIPYYDEKIPENVKKTTLRIKYWYGNKQYKFITNDIKSKWPVTFENTISFNIPLVSATLLDVNNEPVRDITNKVRRYSGPKNDFHGQNVPIKDMLYYEEETLKNEYPKIKLVNAIGMSKTVSTYEDVITSLRIP
jgi:hypothetical protein